jgi:3-oxoacyl-[acyl-carrier protein] reductase
MGGKLLIILTGASGGIGGDLIPSLAEVDSLIGIYNNANPPTRDLKNVSLQKLNLLEPGEIEDFISTRKSELTRVTVLHFAAASIDGLVASYSESDWDHVLNVNLKAAFLLNKALLPLMMRDKWGRIVHISSYVARNGRVGTLPYSTSKAGLIGMSRTIAKEYGRFNITANVLTLGYFNSGLTQNLKEEDRNRILAQIPSKKFGDIGNISNAIIFLMRSDYVNGAEVQIDGGI